MRNVMAQPDLGYHIEGFVDDNLEKGVIGTFQLLGGTDHSRAYCASVLIDEVLITLPWHARTRIIEIIEVSEASGAHVKIVPDLFQLSLSKIAVDAVGGIPLIGVKESTISGGALAISRDGRDSLRPPLYHSFASNGRYRPIHKTYFARSHDFSATAGWTRRQTLYGVQIPDHARRSRRRKSNAAAFERGAGSAL